jgi:hypothetical protein
MTWTTKLCIIKNLKILLLIKMHVDKLWISADIQLKGFFLIWIIISISLNLKKNFMLDDETLTFSIETDGKTLSMTCNCILLQFDINSFSMKRTNPENKYRFVHNRMCIAILISGWVDKSNARH